MPLSDTAIRNAKPADKPRKLADGGGLYIEVAPSGGKWWRFKYRFEGKEKRLSLGVYPDVGLNPDCPLEIIIPHSCPNRCSPGSIAA